MSQFQPPESDDMQREGRPRRARAAEMDEDVDNIQGMPEYKNPSFSVAGHLCICLSRIVFVSCFPCCCPCGIRMIQDYERGVKLRLGRRVHKGTKHGGMHILLPYVDQLLKVDVRERTINIPSQSIITREGMSISVDGVVYFRVIAAEKALLGIENVFSAVSMLAQTKLREVLGTKKFEEIQIHRDAIAAQLQQDLDAATDPWGLKVTRVELTDVRLPKSLERAMATEAEAQRNARAKVIEAEGERQAAQTLKEAAAVMSAEPAAIQLRFLQTMTQISAEKNSTILLPFPSNLLNSLGNIAQSREQQQFDPQMQLQMAQMVQQYQQQQHQQQQQPPQKQQQPPQKQQSSPGIPGLSALSGNI